MTGDWVRVATFGQGWQADLAESVLRGGGIPARRDAVAIGYAYGLDGHHVLVPPEAEGEARALLQDGAERAGDDPAADPSLEGRLVSSLLELLRIPSVTGDERALADALARRYRHEEVRRLGDSLIVGVEDPDRPNVLLVAHLDTVPPATSDGPPGLRDGRVVGRGASDMKAGLAVAMDVFEDPALRAGPHNTLLVAYAREEGPNADNELGPLLAAAAELRDADLAIVLEPTDLEVQLGCMGALHAEVAFAGRAAHSARPWQGENALTAAAPFLAELHGLAPRDVTVDGLGYREVVVATQAWTGSARNVVPDRFTVNVNYRFAPDKGLEAAEARVRELVADRAAVTVVDRAPAGRPFRDAPLVSRFLSAVGATMGPKQAWTDVARFSEVGVPALNYGPGSTAQAHQAGEYVLVEDLLAARAGLARFLSHGG